MSESEETRRYDAVLTRRDLREVKEEVTLAVKSLRDDIRQDLHAIAKGLEKANERHAENDIWRAQIDMRLAAGVERMNSLKAEIEARVKKENVVYMVAGFTAAGGGAGAILMKLLGG